MVRLAAAGDLDAMVAIVAESPTAPQWSAADFRSMLELQGGATQADAVLQRTVLVVSANDVVAGFAVYTLLLAAFPPEAELENLAVATSYRRRGVAVLLLHAVEAAVTGAGAEALMLEVRASNTAALSLYREAGFRAAGDRKAYYAAPVEDAVLMQLALAR